MDKKTEQDKLWGELREDKRTHLKSMFINDQNGNDEYTDGYLNALIDIFGAHNLNPQIKTWEDVSIHKPEVWDDINKLGREIVNHVNINGKLYKKLIATIQIQKLIKFGYGGQITKTEWEDNNCRKYVIEYYPQDGRKFVDSDYCIGEYRFIAFHTLKQREEFWSYESNRELVKLYFMM